MNLSASYCSSGFESGWTIYLDQSSVTKSQYGLSQFVDGEYPRNGDDDDVEDDLSMVSDASSGPPHYSVEDDDYYDQYAKKDKNKGKEHGRIQQYLHLDDTTSSAEKTTKSESSMEHVLEDSHGFSANTHSRRKSGTKKRFGFFQSEKSNSKPIGGHQGRKKK